MNPDKYTNDQELIELRLQLHHEKCRADNLWEVVKFERAERKRLEAQVDELNTMLKAEREVTDAWTKDASRSRDQYNGIIDTQLSAIADLKAKVERLRNAGDAMVELLVQMDVVMDMDSDHPEVEAWNAAKEGKPS